MRFLTVLAIAIATSYGGLALADDTLSAKFDKASCAVVKIQTATDAGTGFFIDDQGTILTAAHVVTRRHLTHEPEGYMLRINLDANIIITTHDHKKFSVSAPAPTSSDAENGGHDLYLLRSGIRHGCYISIDRTAKTVIGDTVIAIGFPASSNSQVLYQGFVSSRETSVHLLGPVDNEPGRAENISYDVIRAQMPITPGASGSPLINGHGKAIGVMSEIPVLALADLQNLVQSELAPGGPQVRMEVGGFDALKLTAELTYLVQNFESPGFGLAVPLSYLAFQKGETQGVSRQIDQAP